MRKKSNKPPLHKRLDTSIRQYFPSWAKRRAAERLETKQMEWLATGYDSAANSMQRRRVSTMKVSEDASSTESELDDIREKSIDTWRNNPLYSSLMRRGVDNIIGTGLQLIPKTSDTDLNNELQAAFDEYCTAKGGWDCTRRLSMAQAQRLHMFSVWREGDFLMYRSDEGWQFFQGSQIGTPINYNRASKRIIKGVEKDAMDRHVRYWVAEFSKHGYLETSKARGLRADKCQLVMNPEFFNQTRGLPVYQNALGQFADFYSYLEAELLTTMAASCNMLEVNSPHQNAMEALGLSTNSSDKISDDIRNIKVSPAAVYHTYSGESIKPISFDRPKGSFPDYVRANLRLLGIPIGLPLEIALMDYTQTNFAAAKMAITQAALTFLFWQGVTENLFMAPIYYDWLDRQTDVKIPKREKLPRKYEIIPNKSSWIDAYKESLAINEGIDGGWETRSHAVKEHMHREWEDVIREQANELLMYDKVAKEQNIDVNRLIGYAGLVETKTPEGYEQLIETAVAKVMNKLT